MIKNDAWCINNGLSFYMPITKHAYYRYKNMLIKKHSY